MSVTPNERRGVRYKDGEFYLRCDRCARHAKSTAYWPLTTEFWDVRRGFSRCRACWNAYTNDRRLALIKGDPDRARERYRRYYGETRAVQLMKKRQHYYENRDRILAAKREKYHAERAA